MYLCTDLHNKWLISKGKQKPAKQQPPPDGLMAKFKIQDVELLLAQKTFDSPQALRDELLSLQVPMLQCMWVMRVLV
jgi:hypothetical protein